MNQSVFSFSMAQVLRVNNNTAVLEIDDANARTDFQPGIRVLMIDNRFYKPMSLFQYDGRVKISFGLRHAYAACFVLTTGLLAFDLSRDFAFDYDRTDGSFHVSVKLNELGYLRQFVGNISTWLDEEIYFRSALKKIAAFETLYNNQGQDWYAMQSSRGETIN